MAPAFTPASEHDKESQVKVEAVLQGFHQAKSRRWSFEAQWQEAAQIFWPEHANTFSYGYEQQQGTKRAQYQIESYPSICLHRFGAIMNSLFTPWTMNWSPIVADDDYLMKQRGVTPYFAQVSKALWKNRYRPQSGFLEAQVQNWMSVGCFGNQNMFIEELNDPIEGVKGTSYSAIPVGQAYYVTNHRGQVDSFYRAFKWTARMIKQKWPESFPKELETPLEQNSQQRYWVIQYVCPNTEYLPYEIATYRGKKFYSCYVSITGMRILEEGGYNTYPMPNGRYMVAPDEDYGRGPAQMTLGSSKTLQLAKATFLKQAHRLGDPTLLGPDGGLVDSAFRPGDYVEGGVNMDGRPLVQALITGNLEDTEKVIAREQAVLDDGFLTALFQLALKTEDQPQLNARQVLELLEQRGMLLAPTAGRQLMEYCGRIVPRELDVLARLGLLPPQPEVVREAKGEFDIKWDNPIMRMLTAGDAAAFMQAVEMATQIANATGDRSVYHPFALKRAIPAMAISRGAPPDWMATQAEIKAKERADAQQAEREQRAKEMPAQAAIEKAHAISAKAQTGGNIGGTLSGVAPGGMPQIPGNPPGLPGRPGIGGRPGLPGRRA